MWAYLGEEEMDGSCQCSSVTVAARGVRPGSARAREVLPREAGGRRCRPRRARRRAGRPARRQRRRQDHHAADAARRDHARRRHHRGARPPAAGRAQRGHGRRRLLGRLPAPPRPHAGDGGAARVRRPLRRARPEAAAEAGLAQFGISHLANDMASELSSGQRTLVGIVKASMHHPPPARARRAHRVARPRRGRARPARPRGDLRRVRHRRAGHQPQHDRGRAHLRPRRVHLPRQGRGQRLAVEVAEQFGRDNLEEVFLHLATEEEWE